MRSISSIALAATLLAATMGTPSALGQASAGSQPAQAGAPVAPATLDKFLAPIALYPDALILQMVQCAGSPYQVKQVSEWLKLNPGLKGTALQDAASQQGFDASFVAIVLFPQVLQMLADQPDWTRDLGLAFTNDRTGVFDSIQRLRTQAQSVGNLQSNTQQQVQTVTADGGQQVIVIQPANPQVVYVPQYNPQVVYTQPAPAVSSNDNNTGQVIAAGLIGFAAGVIVGAAADDDHDHYYYAAGGWGYRGPALCNSGWNDYYNHRENMANDYYDHRENMANDYYDHRENMAGQRGDNQANRQDTASQNQSDRRAQSSSNQANRQDSRVSGQQTASQNQASRQSSRESASGSWQNRSASSSGSFQNASRGTANRAGTSSGAFSGYQRGSTERASSSRGYSSMSRSSGGASRGGGGRRR